MQLGPLLVAGNLRNKLLMGPTFVREIPFALINDLAMAPWARGGGGGHSPPSNFRNGVRRFLFVLTVVFIYKRAPPCVALPRMLAKKEETLILWNNFYMASQETVKIE